MAMVYISKAHSGVVAFTIDIKLTMKKVSFSVNSQNKEQINTDLRVHVTSGRDLTRTGYHTTQLGFILFNCRRLWLCGNVL